MKELLKIKKFCGIANAEFEIKNFNILIGEQSVGKSTTLKLLYYFKSFFAVDSQCYTNKKAFLENIEKNFFDIFKCKDCNDVKIEYFFKDCKICEDECKEDSHRDLEECHSITINLKKDLGFIISFSREFEKIINEFFTEIEAYKQNDLQEVDQFSGFYRDMLQEKMPGFSRFWQLYVPADRNIISKTGIGSFIFPDNGNNFNFFDEFVNFNKITLR